MKKVTKFSLVTALVFSLVLPTTGAFASEKGDSNVKSEEVESKEFPVSVNGIEVYVPYGKDEVHIEKTKSSSNSVEEDEVNVFDNETNTLLETYRVVDVVKPDTRGIVQLASSGNYSQKWVEKTVTHGPVKVTLRTLIELYTSGSFRQINKVIDHQWQTNSGIHELKNKKQNTISTNNKWPAMEIETLGSATIESTIEASAKLEYTKAGFNVGGSVGTKIIMRKNIDIGFRYSVDI